MEEEEVVIEPTTKINIFNMQKFQIDSSLIKPKENKK